ncbi:hypothetical protein BH09MYX1_BH09MYX1_22400 [soil metagenome]
MLQQQFAGNPPDVEAGRTLAEAQLHLRRLPDAETTLRKVIDLAPGDADTYLALERVLVQENKIQDAIVILEKLLGVDPKRARELYQRMAQYALQLYKDDDAIRYAAKAVELNPDDAEGHRRLGEMYRQRQDIDHAIQEFRAAIAKKERLSIVSFALADLLLSKSQSDEADRLYRRVIRGAPDEELVATAARRSMQINLGKGTLESLEQDLLPLAIGNPQRTIYRRLLVDIYGTLTFALVQRVRHGEGKEADDARAALVRVGGRAVKPLLDALSADDPAQQRIAIDVLGYVQNKNAGAALFAFAIGTADLGLRVRAMIACGGLKDPALLPKYEAHLFPKTAGDDAIPADPVAIAAVWGVARVGDRRALPMLRILAKKGTPEARALAVLGIGILKDRTAIPDVAAIARSADGGNVARAAAAYTLGELGAESEAPTLLALAQGPDALPRELAIIALARMGANKSADPPGGKAAYSAMADAVFAGGDPDSMRARTATDGLKRAGAAALVLLATPSLVKAPVDVLPVPDGSLDVEASLDRLIPRDFAEKDRSAAFMKYADLLQAAAHVSLGTSADRALAVLYAIDTGEGQLKPFVLEGAPAPVAAKAKDLARSLEGSVVPLAKHPNSGLRTKAVVFLAHGSTPEAQAAVVKAIDNDDEGVVRVALAAVGTHPDPAASAAVGKLLANHRNWAVRVLAAQALGRLGAAGSKESSPPLVKAAKDDPYALVREAAIVALATFDRASAVAAAREIAQKDAEPRVREAAKKILAAP